MSRKLYPQTGARVQRPKNRAGLNSAFTMFRRLDSDSAEGLYDLAVEMQEDGVLPAHATIRQPVDMRVTYLERSKLTKELKGFAHGFNAREAISRINEVCPTYGQDLIVSLGRTCLMDRRDETLVIRLDHSQIVAEEYEFICDVMRGLHVHLRSQAFKPHIGLAHIPGLTAPEKRSIARDMQDVIPEEAKLLPLQTYPFSS